MKIYRPIVHVLISVVLASGTGVALASAAGIQLREIEKYPFKASPQREKTIRAGYTRIVAGMTPDQVKNILGEPDEVRPLYEPIVKNAKQIGYSHWFVIRRMVKDGSQNDRQESLVRVSYNFQNLVTAVDSWGLD